MENIQNSAVSFFSFSQVQCGVLANLSSLFCIFKMFIGQCKALLKVPWYK